MLVALAAKLEKLMPSSSVRVELDSLHRWRHGELEPGLHDLKVTGVASRRYPWGAFLLGARMMIEAERFDDAARILEATEDRVPLEPDEIEQLDDRAQLWRILGRSDRAERDAAEYRRLESRPR